jgi:type I restriction enzyme, S subunit
VEVRPGYKQTPAGVVPDEWAVVPLHRVLANSRLGGNYPNRGEESEFPLMKMGNLNRGHFDLTRIDYIVPGVMPEGTHRLAYGDVLFNTRNTLDLVGKVAMWRDEIPIAYFNSNLMRLEFDADVICSNEYANYSLNTADSIARLRALATGTTSVAAIYTRDLMGLHFVVPPKPEQRAIAAALSDLDTLLVGLDRLIAKKRDLKQAAMQQLLTGQTRLPGFDGEWEVMRLGDVLVICHGRSQSDVEAADGPYPILATGGQIGTATRPLYDRPSVLIGRKGTINKPQYMDTPFWTVDTLFYAAMKGSNSARFFYYLFCTIDWMQFNEASGVPSLNARTIESIEICCPGPLEQTAIVAVLADTDSELSVLETRRDKTRALKQAMMQELLTGRTRLVPAGGADA